VPFILLLLTALAGFLQAGGGGPVDLTRLFESFLPPHAAGPRDPFAAAEELLARVAAIGQQITLVAVPAFLWFSTRAFASVRTALNDIYDISVRPGPRRGIVVGFLRAKLRDLVMVLLTLVLFLASTAITGTLALARARGDELGPEWSFIIGTFGNVAGQVLAFGFIVVLFFLLYRFGSQHRIRWRAALVAALFASVAFELARRLYAFYITNVAAWNTAATDAGLVAMILFVIWLYYTALVFLLGGVVAETWELRYLQQRQRWSE
jgi:membrane protein